MATKVIEKHPIPYSSLGNERSVKIIRYGKKTPFKKVYIQTALHAEEPPGMIAIHYLISLLDKADKNGEITGEIILVPCSNPIGSDQWFMEKPMGRFEFSNSVNFNRNFPDLTDRVAEKIKNKLTNDKENNVRLIRSEIEGQLSKLTPESEGDFLKHFLYSQSFDADIVLDLHCDHQAICHVYTGTPLWPDWSDFSAQMEAEATLLCKNSGGGSYDEAGSKIFWELAELFPDYPIPPACFSATLELRGETDVTHEFGKKDANNIFAFLQRRGFIKGQAPELPPLINEATPLKGVDVIKASSPGVVVFLKHPGDFVKKGGVVAEVINPLIDDEDKRITQIKSSVDGILYARKSHRFASPGHIIARIAGKKVISDRGNALLSP